MLWRPAQFAADLFAAGDGLGDKGFAGEVHDGVEAFGLKDIFKPGPIGQIALIELRLRGDGGAVAFAVSQKTDWRRHV